MQSQITDYDFAKSASNLTRQHLAANIYENIHGLASLLGCVDEMILSDKCKAKIKNYKNYPQGKLWIGYELYLYRYIQLHFKEWCEIRGYNSEINYKNIIILIKNLDFRYDKSETSIPSWITDELIQTHRSILIQKEIEKEKKMINEYNELECMYSQHSTAELYEKIIKQEDLIKKNYHYRRLWPNTPIDLKMRYNWRNHGA